MEIKIMYPELIVYALIVSVILLFVWKKRRGKFKKGILVANTRYLENVKIYKTLKVKYLLYKIIIFVFCIVIIGIGATLTARLYKEDKHEEKKEYYNRDIVLCLDFSGSMGGIINKIVDQYIEIVKSLNGDRFGIVVFGGAPSTILPLTDDYNYAISVLEKLKIQNQSLIMHVWTWTGMRAYPCCSSSDGDGLAASILAFDKDNERTKIIVLAADHGVSSYIVSLNEAADLAKKYNVKVYYLDGEPNAYVFASQQETIKEKTRTAEITGGKYYDAKHTDISQIIKDLDSQDKTLLVERNIATTKVDLPEILFPYLFYLTVVLFVLDWRIRV